MDKVAQYVVDAESESKRRDLEERIAGEFLDRASSPEEAEAWAKEFDKKVSDLKRQRRIVEPPDLEDDEPDQSEVRELPPWPEGTFDD